MLFPPLIELFGGLALLYGDAHDIVDNRGYGGVTPKADILDNDVCNAYAVVEHRRMVVALILRQVLIGKAQSVVDHLNGRRRKVLGYIVA